MYKVYHSCLSIFLLLCNIQLPSDSCEELKVSNPTESIEYDMQFIHYITNVDDVHLRY